MKQKREYWIDHTKVIACILVALGHMFQGLVQADILSQAPWIGWFNQTIYYFHVQLFFVCSGYLYQKYGVVDTFGAWKENVLKKMLSLGIPYFTFSLITWVLKAVFSGSVNNEVNSLWYDLFVVPQSPYWYLYTLFFLFLITPTFRSKRMCVAGLVMALLIQIFRKTQVYAISQTANYEIWFVLGMAACVIDLPSLVGKWALGLGVSLLVLFSVASIFVWSYNVQSYGVQVIMGLLACAGVTLLALRFGKQHNKLAAYTMPVFLMHTIFAAGFRTVLLKIGITSGFIHIIVGHVASFLCPMIAARIMERMKLDFFLYPGKYIRTKR